MPTIAASQRNSQSDRIASVFSPLKLTVSMGCLVLFFLVTSTNHSLAEKSGFLSRLFGKNSSETEDAEITVTDPVPYSVNFKQNNKTKESGDIEEQIKKASLLENNLKTLPSGTFSLLKRAHSDTDRLTKALEALGFYNGRVSISIAGLSIDNHNVIDRMETLHARKETVPVEVVIDSGNLFSITSVDFKLTDHPPEYFQPTTETINLSIGSAARSATVLDAEKKILSDARKQGFAFAEVVKRDIWVDHKDQSMKISFLINPGKKAFFGPTLIEGGEKLPGFAEKRIPWQEGEEFSPEKITKLKSSLQKYNVFSSVRIREDLSNKRTGEIPVTVELEERPPHFIGFGTKYSSTDGASLNAYWGHRNLFGGAEQLRIEGKISGVPLDNSPQNEKISTTDQIGYRFAASLTKPNVFSLKDEVTVIPSYFRDITDYYTREGFAAAATYRYQYSDALRIEAGLDYEHARIKRFYDPSFPNNEWYNLYGIPLTISYDRSNSLLDPTSGYRLSGTIEPFVSIGGSSSMLLMKGTASAYMPLDDNNRFVLAGRISTGSISGADLDEIPPSRRFFAGGGGSVRGYDYRSLGPKNAQDWVIGGQSYFEASAELRMKMTETIGLVTFLDAGNAFSKDYPDFSEDLRYSAGIGLRYHTPVGPLRLDIARGLNLEADDPEFGIYISIGQAF